MKNSVLLLILFMPNWIFAQHDDVVFQSPQDSYLQQPIQTHAFDTAKWNSLTTGLDYSEDQIKPKKEQKSDPEAAKAFANFMKILLIGIGLAVLIFLIVKMANGENVFSPNNNKIKPLAGDINLEKIEGNLHEAELDGHIRQAVTEGDFALAVRLYYLAILKELSLKKLIKWKKDKTNGEYLRELAGSQLFPTVQELTLIFERVWYGKIPLQAGDFAQIEAKFKRAIGSV